MSAVAMGLLYVVAGVNHFRVPRVYERMMPPWLPAHRELVLLSGAFEVLLGVGVVVPATRTLAAYGVIALLLAVFPANVQMFREPEKWAKVPRWLLVLRLPLQGLLVWWAWTVAS